MWEAKAEGRKVIVLSRNKEGAKWVYKHIDRLGFDPLYVDGSAGPATRRAQPHLLAILLGFVPIAEAIGVTRGTAVKKARRLSCPATNSLR